MVGAMKSTSVSCGQSGGPTGVLAFPLRWGASFLGQRRAADRAIASRTIEFALDRDSLWRIAGNVRGVRIECRQGRLWLTQTGAAADVILQPGQSFVSDDGGVIVVQPVPAANATEETTLGTLTVTPGAAGLRIQRRQTVASPVRVGRDLVDRDQTEVWEQVAFIALWFCGVFSVWYCLRMLLSQY